MTFSSNSKSNLFIFLTLVSALTAKPMFQDRPGTPKTLKPKAMHADGSPPQNRRTSPKSPACAFPALSIQPEALLPFNCSFGSSVSPGGFSPAEPSPGPDFTLSPINNFPLSQTQFSGYLHGINRLMESPYAIDAINAFREGCPEIKDLIIPELDDGQTLEKQGLNARLIIKQIYFKNKTTPSKDELDQAVMDLFLAHDLALIIQAIPNSKRLSESEKPAILSSAKKALNTHNLGAVLFLQSIQPEGPYWAFVQTIKSRGQYPEVNQNHKFYPVAQLHKARIHLTSHDSDVEYLSNLQGLLDALSLD